MINNDEIYFKGLIEYLNWFLDIPKTSALDISSEVSLSDLNSIFNIDLKFYLTEALIDKLKATVTSLPLKPTCFLLGLGLSPKIIEQVIKHYSASDSLIKVIQENPYDLLNIEGIPFKRIDKIYLDELGLPEDSPVRHKAFVIYQLNNLCQKNGHVYIDLELFMNSNFEVEINRDLIKRYLKELILENKIILHGKKLYSNAHYKAENFSAEILAKIITDKRHISFFKDLDINLFISNYEETQSENILNSKWKGMDWKDQKFQFSDKQKEAIHKFIKEKLLIISGLPGTGKTSLIKAIFDISKNKNLRVCLLAPTGIAAKRLTETSGHDAMTIHKKLGFDGSFWNKKDKNLLAEDVIIVDEFSMVDQVLLYHLLLALPNKEYKLVFVGDSAQLPSVAPGNVLKELIGAKIIPHVALDKIFRQEDTSNIIVNAHLINNGNTNLVSGKKDFIFMETEDEEQIIQNILLITEKLRDKNFHIISPTYKGLLGVTNLNNLIQDVLNPRLDETVFKTDLFSFRLEDKVMILKNDYQNEVYNGESGKIVDIKTSKKLIQILINGKIIEYSFKDAYSTITLDYARTAHKCQSLEYDYVVLPWVNDFTIQLQRNLLYTAITRAKKKVFILGHKKALVDAIKNNKITRRNSILSSRILTCIGILNNEQKEQGEF